VVLHGCGGVSEHHHRWAAEIVRWGYVVLVLNSFGPRGYRNICAETSQVSVMARAYDAYAAADHLRGLPHVRGDRIGVVGFSHGGMAALRAVQRRTVSSLDWRPFQASVAFYPACEAIDPEIVTSLLVLIGDNDDWTPASRCRDVEPILRPREHVAGRWSSTQTPTMPSIGSCRLDRSWVPASGDTWSTTEPPRRMRR
jgi:dienelactone hydrolase